MTNSINLNNIDKILLSLSKETGKLIEYEEAEQMIHPIIISIGLTTEEKTIIDGLIHLEGEYPIDAENMLKQLGAVSINSDNFNIKRLIKRSNFITDKDLNSFDTKIISDNNYFDIIYQNNDCQVIKTTLYQNDRLYYLNKYKLTIRAMHKLLMQSYNTDKFANYFSIKLELMNKYVKYQSKYLNWKLISNKEESCDTEWF